MSKWVEIKPAQRRVRDGGAEDNCRHIWDCEVTEEGEPDYRLNRMMWGPIPRVYAKCLGCNARTWFSKEEWESIPEAKDSDTSA